MAGHATLAHPWNDSFQAVRPFGSSDLPPDQFPEHPVDLH